MSISGYREFQVEGDSYLRVGRNGRSKPAIFTPEIRFNVLSMAIEKYIMAILMQAGALPDNHTFHDLTAAMELVAPLEPSVIELLHRMDAHNNICSVADYSRTVPDEAALARLLEAAESTRDMADALLGPLSESELHKA